VNETIRVSVIGVGALGRHHARVATQIPGVLAAGVFDSRPDRAREVAAEHGILAFSSLEEAIEKSDALVVATPTVTHREIAARILDAGKPVMVEKPLAIDLAEADDLVARAEKAGVALQVGHVERFNPAFEAALSQVTAPRFVEAHRLGAFSARSTDIDVVLDLMIHDLQLVQALVRRPVREIRAAGVAVLTPRPDIANARVEFEGGCVANLTASRVSADKVRKFRIFSPALYVSLDLAAFTIDAVGIIQTETGARIVPRLIPVTRDEPLRREMEAFVGACRERTVPVVSGSDGRAALALALDVARAIDENLRKYL
jgi:predicted dehydrogenase